MIMNNRLYDALKWIARIVLPALGTLYFALAQIWGLPLGQEIVGTIAAVDTFLQVLLGISSHNYNKAEEQAAAEGKITFLNVIDEKKPDDKGE